ncbi:hypothetical protein CHUAL_013393 [Chamberlinius hualienensis]
MSLLEQKRLQWASEKEQLQEWNPWGKPGCGAPVISYTSSTVTHSTQQQQLTVWSQNFPKSENYPTDISTPLHISCTPSDFIGRAERNRLPPIPPSSVTPGVIGQRSLPSTVPSSSMEYHNNPFIYTYAYDLWREEAKKQWLQELEKQREEQRSKKLNKTGISNSTNDINCVSSPSKVNLSNTSCDQPNGFSGLPSVVTATSPVSAVDGQPWTNKGFVRGANVPVDPITQSELELKRAKAIEQQQIIQKQIEDRRLLKEEEKAEKKRRELEDEMRLSKENFMPSIINNNQIKKVEMKDSDKVAAVNVVAPQQTSFCLPDVLDGAVIKSSTLESKISEEVSSHANDRVNGTAKVKNEKYISCEEEEPYVVNRVLTPTKYRENPIKYRDFATQTDFPTSDGFPLRKDAATSTKDNKLKQINQKGIKTKTESGNISKTKAKNTKDRSPVRKSTDKNSKEQKNSMAKVSKRSSRIDSYDSNVKNQVTKQSEHQLKSNRSQKSVGSGSSTAQQQQSAHRSRSRSSAEYQKKIIADETEAQNILQRRSLSPLMSYSRLTATGSSSTCDEGDLSSFPRQTRRKRRQWESPGRDEVPHFYTDSPQLPDGRSVRRNRYATDNKSLQNYVKDFTEMDETDVGINTPSVRSCSPPVPALRRLQLQQSAIAEGINFCLSEHDATVPCSEPGFEPVTQKASFEGDIAPGEPAECHQSDHPGILSSSVIENSTNQYFVQNNDVNRDDILRKLSFIRHSLTLKQQEMNQITNGKKYVFLNDDT